MKDKLTEFSTAKLAKEKGFEAMLQTYFSTDGKFYQPSCGINRKLSTSRTHLGADTKEDFEAYISEMDNSLDNFILAPTQSLLQRWLREEHKILIAILPWKDHQDDVNDPIRFRPMIHRVKTYGEYPTYEEALEEGLKQALTLIK